MCRPRSGGGSRTPAPGLHSTCKLPRRCHGLETTAVVSSHRPDYGDRLRGPDPNICSGYRWTDEPGLKSPRRDGPLQALHDEAIKVIDLDRYIRRRCEFM